ncbi:MAG TPA: hypothetical protein VFL60_04520 [Gaiellaceae bacterium]|nr:hypothetical protein [Gaiellaceae bacterium]
MEALGTRLDASRRHLVRARSALAAGAARVETWPLAAVLAGFVVVEWLAVLALALTVRHNGWIYYQGGDQLWHYTLAWLLAHGTLGYALVGYVWPALLSPIALAAGPNLVSALPAVVLLNVLVLLPVAMCALYGVAARIGGRLFGYWTLLVWVTLPFLGILYTNQGYHERYTEATLPQSFGLTALSDFPSMVAAVVSVYFCARIVLTASPTVVDALAAGAAGGFAIGVKPATTFFLVGPALAFLARRYLRYAAFYVAGLVPFVITLAVWKDRSFGYLPVIGHSAAHPVPGLASGAPLLGLGLGKYFQLNWGQLAFNIDQLREHFWSGHFVIWLFLAGLVALLRMSPRGFLLVGGAVLPFAIAKGSYVGSSIEDTSFFRLLMPCFPWFVLALAALPFLVPRSTERLPAYPEPRRLLRGRLPAASVAVVVALTTLGPLVAFAAAGTSLRGKVAAKAPGATMIIPVGVDLGTTAVARDGRVTLTWNAQRPAAGKVFYRVWRVQKGPGLDLACSTALSRSPLCSLDSGDLGATAATSFTDRPGRGTWVYRVAVAANWLDDPQFGDPYLAGKPVVVRVR